MSIEIKNYAVAALDSGSNVEIVPATAGRQKNVKSLSLSVSNASGLYSSSSPQNAYEALACGVPSCVVFDSAGSVNTNSLSRGIFESFYLDDETTFVIGSNADSVGSEARHYAQVLKINATTGDITPGRPLILNSLGGGYFFPDSRPYQRNWSYDTATKNWIKCYKFGSNIFLAIPSSSVNVEIYRFSIGVDGSTLTYSGKTDVSISNNSRITLASKKTTDTTVDAYLVAACYGGANTMSIKLIPLNTNGTVGTPTTTSFSGITSGSSGVVAHVGRMSPTSDTYIFGFSASDAAGFNLGLVSYNKDTQAFSVASTAQRSSYSGSASYANIFEIGTDGNPGVVVSWYDASNYYLSSYVSTSSLSSAANIHSASYPQLASNRVSHCTVYGNRSFYLHAINSATSIEYAINVSTSGAFSVTSASHTNQYNVASIGLIAGRRLYVWRQMNSNFHSSHIPSTGGGMLYYTGNTTGRYNKKPIKFGLPSPWRTAYLENGAVAVADGGFIHYYDSSLNWTHSVDLSNLYTSVSMENRGMMPHRIKPVRNWSTSTSTGYMIGLAVNFHIESGNPLHISPSGSNSHGYVSTLTSVAPSSIPGFFSGSSASYARVRMSTSYGGFAGDFEVNEVGQTVALGLSYNGSTYFWSMWSLLASASANTASQTLSTGSSTMANQLGEYGMSLALTGATATSGQFVVQAIGSLTGYTGIQTQSVIWTPSTGSVSSGSAPGYSLTNSGVNASQIGITAYIKTYSHSWRFNGKHYGVYAVGKCLRVFEAGLMIYSYGEELSASTLYTTSGYATCDPIIIPKLGGGCLCLLRNRTSDTSKTAVLIAANGALAGAHEFTVAGPFDIAGAGSSCASSNEALLIMDSSSHEVDRLVGVSPQPTSTVSATIYIKKSGVSYPVAKTSILAGDVVSSGSEVALEDGASLEVSTDTSKVLSVATGVVEKF